MDGLPSPSSFESISRTLYAPLLPPLGAVISGVLFASWLEPDLTTGLAAAAASGALWLLGRRQRLPWACFLAGNALLFWLSATNTQWQAPGPKPTIDAAPRELVTLRGCVASLPQRETGRISFTFAPHQAAQVRVLQYLKDGESAPAWQYGDILELPLRLKPIRNSGNPGAFDAERYFAFRHIYWSANVASGYPVKVERGACGEAWQSYVFRVRTFLLQRIAHLSAGDHYVETMLGALLLGENGRLEDADTEAYRRTGTYHALVISGLHVSMLAGACFALLRLFPLNRQEAHLLTALTMLLYALLCGLAAPVSRAACGYLLYAASKFFYRRGRPINLLAAVALLFLFADPSQLYEASFQLSFLAVLTLAGLAAPWLESSSGLWREALRGLAGQRLRGMKWGASRRMLELQLTAQTLHLLTGLPQPWVTRVLSSLILGLCWLADLLATSTLLLIGLALPMVLYFHRLSFASLTANLPVVILLSLTIPLGFLGLLIGPVLAPVLRWLLLAARASVDWHLSWDLALRLPDPPVWLTASLIAALTLTAWLAHRRSRWVWAGALLSLGFFITLAVSPHWQSPRLRPGHLEFTAVDVGQGDSLFLATPAGHLAVLDGGGSISPRSDPGEKAVSPYLWRRGISRLDTLIASHGDLDHIGGLLAMHENFRPRELWVSAQIRGPRWDQLLTAAQRQGTRLRYLAAGDSLRLGEVTVETLWPPRDAPIEKSNLTSLVLLLQHGRHRFLLTGDIEASVESQLLDNPQLQRIDVLKLAHHGSRTSTSPDFLERTQPALAIASAGFANQFHHPHPSVLHRLQQARTLLLRTDLEGAISVFSDGQRLHTQTHRLWGQSRVASIPLSLALE